MVSHDFAEGMTQGYAQGAQATAELIRNRLASLPPRPDITAMVDELTRDYELEPDADHSAFWQELPPSRSTDGREARERLKTKPGRASWQG
jgi:hypothetical protein